MMFAVILAIVGMIFKVSMGLAMAISRFTVLVFDRLRNVDSGPGVRESNRGRRVDRVRPRAPNVEREIRGGVSRQPTISIRSRTDGR